LTVKYLPPLQYGRGGPLGFDELGEWRMNGSCRIVVCFMRNNSYRAEKHGLFIEQVIHDASGGVTQPSLATEFAALPQKIPRSMQVPHGTAAHVLASIVPGHRSPIAKNPRRAS
jgi:hypothetical protein